MSITSSVVLITLFNLPLAAMIGIALVRLEERKTRWLFTLLALALMLWATPLVLVRADFLGEAAIAAASRTTFCGGVLAVLFLFLFFQHFSAIAARWLRNLVVANAALVLLATLTGFVENGVRPVPGGFAPVRGILHKYYVLSQSATVILAFYLVLRAYRTSESALLRFQLRSMGGYGFLGFLFPIINNGLMPVLVDDYPYPAFGVVGVLLFQFGIFNMLVRGQWLFMRSILGRLHRSIAWNRRENITSLSRLVELLNSIVSGNINQFKEVFSFTGESGTALQMHAQSEPSASPYSAPARFNEQVMPKWNQGLIDNLVRLEADNKRLALYLTKAETLVSDRWLSSAKKSVERPHELDLPLLPVKLYEAEHTQRVAENRQLWGEEILVSSPELFALMETLRNLRKSNLPVFFEGETGVGKATLARALNYLRSQQKPLSLDCTYQTRQLAARMARLVDRARKENRAGVLVRHLDQVRPEEIAPFIGYLMGHDGLPHVYITVKSLESLSAKIAEPGQRAFADSLPQIRLSPLASRGDDLRAQLFYFAAKICGERSLPVESIAKPLITSAAQYSWPGNTAELKARLEQALLLLTTGTALEATSLNLREAPRALEGKSMSALEKAERDVIWECLQRRRFNQRQTAIELEITINTLRAKMEKYGLQIPEQK